MSAAVPIFRGRRPLALGLTDVSATLGPIVMSPLFRWSTEVYSRRGLVILLAAFTMQCCVFGALLRRVKCII